MFLVQLNVGYLSVVQYRMCVCGTTSYCLTQSSSRCPEVLSEHIGTTLKVRETQHLFDSSAIDAPICLRALRNDRHVCVAKSFLDSVASFNSSTQPSVHVIFVETPFVTRYAPQRSCNHVTKQEHCCVRLLIHHQMTWIYLC